MLRSTFPCLPAAFAGALLLCAAARPSQAADASRWDGGDRAALRLVAGSGDAGGTLRAGLEIKLAPGWKTYWRYPGEAGIPPRFDFGASQNVKAVAVGWPAPMRFSDGGVTSIGYKRGVIFPLRVEPADPRAPVVLRAEVDYAVCDSICLPAEGKAELPLAAAASPHDEALRKSEAQVPKPAGIGEAGPLAIAAVTQRAGSPRQVLVDVAGPAAGLDLFAEGPTPDWSLPLPEKVAGAPEGMQRFAFDLDGIPKGVSPADAVLRLTATSPDAAVETTFRLD